MYHVSSSAFTSKPQACLRWLRNDSIVFLFWVLAVLISHHSAVRWLIISFFDCIVQVAPWTKLPAFYLLDAISKNVYEPYARQFASFVIPLFLETYHLVDENTRSKMEEMLLTWRTGSPTGKELFGVAPQIAIERGVWGDGGGSHQVRTLSLHILFIII